MPATLKQADSAISGRRAHLSFGPSDSSGDTVSPPRKQLVDEQLAAIIELTGLLQTQETPAGACRVAALELARFLNAERVFAGECPTTDAACRVAAISNLDTFDPANPFVRLAQAVMDETILRGEATQWPPESKDVSHALLAHQQFAAECGDQCLLSLPLRDETGRVRGAWLAVFRQNDDLLPARQFLLAAAGPVAATLALLARAQRGPIARLARDAWQWIGSGGWRTSATAAGLVAALAAWPMKHHVSCSCELEPVVRRHVAAPFAGPLEKAFVEPGDVVQKDQVLAQMDGREVRWELAGVDADYHRATKERVGHLATHESGKAELARFEADRLRLRRELLEHRDQNLLIRSPIDGVVVSGDLKRSEGMPLTTGQNLFEIAPLDQMVVEMAVSASDIAYVRAGQSVTIRFDGAPWQRYAAQLTRVQPRAELRDHDHVFIAEVRLENRSDQLRPGMRGRAEILAGRQPLGWQWLRKPLAAAVAWLGW